MHSRFPRPAFSAFARTAIVVLAAATTPSLLAQAISFANNAIGISFPNADTYMVASVVPCDYNGDGNTDLIAFTQTLSGVTPAGTQLVLLTGDGTGNFTSQALPITPYRGSQVLVADIDGDGHQDFLYIYGGTATTSTTTGYTGAMEVWLGDGKGNFHQSAVYPLLTSGATPQVGDVTAALGDFNHDGKRDVAIITAYNPDEDPFHHLTYLDVFINKGSAFKHTYAYIYADNYAYLGPVGDYNHDGNSDLVLIAENRTNFTVLNGKGDGTFAVPEKPTYTLNTEYMLTMSTADLNGDGRSDLVLSLLPTSDPTIPPKMATLLARQAGGFYWYDDYVPTYPYARPTPTYDYALLADLNGDGRPDLIYFDEDSGAIRAFPGEAGAHFGPDQLITFAQYEFGLIAAPFKTGGLPNLLYFGARSPTGPGYLQVQVNISK